MKNYKYDILTVIITAFWGASFILIKNIPADTNPFLFLALRFTTAAVLLFILFFKKMRLINKKIILYSILLGAILLVYLVLQVIGLRYTSSSNSAFIVALSLIFVPVLSSVILKKTPAKSSVFGVILSMVGLYYITDGINTSMNIGDLLNLISAFLVAVHIIAADKLIEKLSGDKSDRRKNAGFLLGVGQIGATAVLSWIIVFMFHVPVDFNRFSYDFIIVFVLTGIFCTAVSYTLQVYVQQFMNPTRLAVMLMLEPVFALAYALFIPDNSGNTEILTLTKIIGIIFILTGSLISEAGIAEKLFKNKRAD